MPIENIMQDFKSTEKEMLIESMEKLMEHIYENRIHQFEIFKSLSTNDLEKMFKNMHDPNIILRKTSTKFLCELLYNNIEIQTLFCELTGLIPMKGKVCLNKIPDTFKPFYKEIPVLLDSIKNIKEEELDERPLCWFYNSENIKQKGNGIEFKYIDNNKLDRKTNIENFTDPMYCLIGFIIFENKSKENIEKNINDKNEAKNKSPKINKASKIVEKKKIIEKPKTPIPKLINNNTNSDSYKMAKQSQKIRPTTEKKLKDECQTERPNEKLTPKTPDLENLYKTADKAFNVEIQRISLMSDKDEKDEFSKTQENIKNKINIETCFTSTNPNPKISISNPRTRLLSPQIISNQKKGYNSVSTSYHMAPPTKITSLKNKEIKETRTKSNNFMSIIEPKIKEEKKINVIENPKSQSLLQDYNFKFEKKIGETINLFNPKNIKNEKFIKPKTPVDKNKNNPLKKTFSGTPQQKKLINKSSNFNNDASKTNNSSNFIQKEEISKSKTETLMNDSFGKINKNFIKKKIGKTTEINKYQQEIEEIPENEHNENILQNEFNLSQPNNSGSFMNTPRISDPNIKDTILVVRKSHDLGNSYYNQRKKKKSFEINPNNKTNDDNIKINNKKNSQNGKLIDKIYSSKNKNIEKRSTTPSSKDQIKTKKNGQDTTIFKNIGIKSKKI